MSDVSYESALNPKRDLGDEFAMIVKNQPTLLSIVSFNGGAVNNKHEWLEYVLSANTDTLNANVTSTGQATITPATVSKFAVGQILAFEGSDEIMAVTSLGTTTIAVTRGYGSSDPDASISSGALIRIVSTPLAENSSAGDDPGTNLGVEYNYTQIFARTAVVSGTAENAAQYGIESLIRFRVNEHLIEGDLSCELQARHDHAHDPEVENVAAGYHQMRRVRLLRIGRRQGLLVRPPQHRERPQRR